MVNRVLQSGLRGRLSNLGPRFIINGAVLLLSLFILLLSLDSGLDAYREHQKASRIKLSSIVADEAIQAAAIAAIERGMTAAILGSNGKAQIDEADFVDIRRRSIAAWDRTVQAYRALPASTMVRHAFRRVSQAEQRLVEARKRVDLIAKGVREPILIPEWIAVVAQYNSSLEQLRNVVFAQDLWDQDLATLNISLRHWIWMASEYAGLERGVLAYYVSKGEPLAEATLGQLNSYRTIVVHNMDEILAVVEQEETNPIITQAARKAQRVFLDEFEKTRRAIYGAAATGNYPLTGSEWVTKATEAINSILDLAGAISVVSGNAADQLVRTSNMHMVRSVIVIIITCMLVVLSVVKVRQTTNLLHREKELAEVTLHSIGDAVITTDGEARVEYMNPIAEQYSGWTTLEARGRPLREVFNIVMGFTREPCQNPIERCLHEKRVVGLDDNTVLIHRNGREFAIEDSAAPIHDSSGNIVGAVMVFYDVSSGESHNHLLAHYATHDALTGLANRREFERRLTDMLVRAHGSEERHALCYMDLDQFKVVNDTCGHIVGDKLLRQLTYLLEQHIRDADTLARIGGDEFGLLLENCPLERAHAIAENIRKVVHKFRFVWEDKTFELGCSIGLVPITAESVSPADLLSEADAACYAAKDNGRNRVQIFEPGNIELARRHGEMQWIARLNQALDENRLHLYVQDIVPLDDDMPMHREMLLRLEDEDGRIIPPGSFIPAAERYGLMATIDRWVIGHSFRWLASRLKSTSESTIYNINLSGVSVSDKDRLLDYIHEQQEMYHIPPQRVCFELTETAAVQNLAQAADLIVALKAEGFRFALDDFGSGLSSFMYLKTMPVDYLKINGSFVRDMEHNQVDYAMVQSINSIGHVMELQTIAEFVENENIMKLLRKIGIDYAQGYGISMPRPLQELDLEDVTIPERA